MFMFHGMQDRLPLATLEILDRCRQEPRQLRSSLREASERFQSRLPRILTC